MVLYSVVMKENLDHCQGMSHKGLSICVYLGSRGTFVFGQIDVSPKQGGLTSGHVQHVGNQSELFKEHLLGSLFELSAKSRYADQVLSEIMGIDIYCV